MGLFCLKGGHKKVGVSRKSKIKRRDGQTFLMFTPCDKEKF